MHVSINMTDMPIEVLDIKPVNPLISKCQIKVCYVGQEANRNRSIITKEVAKELANSIPGCPIVGYYNSDKKDFEEHNRTIEISNGTIKISDTTKPYGFVSMDAKVWFQWFEDDGVAHEYLVTEGYIWTGQYPESQRIIEHGNNQSMELDDNTLDAVWTKDNNGKPQFFIINEAIMSKLCILGEDVEPCFEGASISKVQFSFEDNFKQELFSLIKTMKEILSNDEGGTPVFNTYTVEIGGHLWDAIYDYMWENCRCDNNELQYTVAGVYEDNNQKFAILQDRQNLTYSRLDFSLTDQEGFVPGTEITQVTLDFNPSDNAQFALEDIQKFEVEFKKKKEEESNKKNAEDTKPEKEPTDNKSDSDSSKEDKKSEVSPTDEDNKESEEDEDKKKKKAKYNLDEVTEYQELLVKYNELENSVKELNTTITQLTNDNAELIKFKNRIEKDKKEKLIESFFMLNEEQKKDCVDNIDKYSLDEIEAKLSVICVRNKVSFDLNDSEKKKEEEVKTTTYNLDSTVDDAYANMPAWVARAIEVKNEGNFN